MRLPILDIKRSDGPAALSAYRLSPLEAMVIAQMEDALSVLPRNAPLEECHHVVTAAGARHGLRRSASIALWTRGSLRMFEAGLFDHPAIEVGPRIERLVAFAFDQAGQELSATRALCPFLVTVGLGPPGLLRFDHRNPDIAAAEARNAATRLDFEVQVYALAMPGIQDPAAQRVPVYVESAQRDTLPAHLFVRDFSTGRTPGFTGPSQRIGEANNLFRGWVEPRL